MYVCMSIHISIHVSAYTTLMYALCVCYMVSPLCVCVRYMATCILLCGFDETLSDGVHTFYLSQPLG